MNGESAGLCGLVIRLATVVAVSVISEITLARAEGSNAVLRAGTAKIDITPDKPVTMAGYASRKGLSTGVHDPLSARVIAFESAGVRLVLVSADLIGFYDGTAEYLRGAIQGELKLEPSELFLSAIHTHSGPNLTVDKEKGHANNFEYTAALKAKLIEAIGKALGDMTAVQVGAGIGYCPIGANRRELKLESSGDSSIVLGRNPYGPTDRQVQVIKLARADGTAVAALFDYATHATCLGGNNYVISGDVMGLAEQFVEKIIGKGAVAPAFAGASGNIDPWFRVLPSFNEEPGWVPEPVLLGTMLGEEVVHVFRSVGNVSAGGPIAGAFRVLQLPGKAQDGSDGKKAPSQVSLCLTVARLGDIGFVGLGAEVLTEVGMAIKSASPYKNTLVVTHCNGAAGYLPPASLYVEGGYEVKSSPFAPQAAEIVEREAIKALHELQGLP